jgi:hypothetical protein
MEGVRESLADAGEINPAFGQQNRFAAIGLNR